MERRPGHRASRSFNGIRTSVAVLPMAPFSPGRSELDYSSRARLARGNLGFSMPLKDAGFEYQEPTSPEVSCIGQIKLKQKRAKESRQEKSSKEKKKMSKLKKFIFGSFQNKNRAEKEDEEEKCTQGLVSYPSLGQIKRYASGSYDARFGNMFVQKEVEVVGSMPGPLSSESLPPKPGRKVEGPCIWKRRSMAPPKELEVCRIPAEIFEIRKPFTT